MLAKIFYKTSSSWIFPQNCSQNAVVCVTLLFDIVEPS